MSSLSVSGWVFPYFNTHSCNFIRPYEVTCLISHHRSLEHSSIHVYEVMKQICKQPMFLCMNLYRRMSVCKNAVLYVGAQVPTAFDMCYRPYAGLVVGSHLCWWRTFRSNGRFVTSFPITKRWFGIGSCRNLTTHGYYTYFA